MTGTKNDRLQTSTCSVAVLPEPRDISVTISDRDLKWDYMRASGAGGPSQMFFVANKEIFSRSGREHG